MLKVKRLKFSTGWGEGGGVENMNTFFGLGYFVDIFRHLKSDYFMGFISTKLVMITFSVLEPGFHGQLFL